MNTIYIPLLVITFALHYSFVQLLLGTPIIALYLRLTGNFNHSSSWTFIKHHYPICISLTITTGVAPLLFSQVLFHRNFYQSFINMYPFPLMILFVIAVLFYNSYLIQKVEKYVVLLLVIQISLLFLCVLFFTSLTNNISHPELFESHYWSQSLPALYWKRLPIHYLFGIIGSGIFFTFSHKSMIVRSLILFMSGLIMAIYREKIRIQILDDSFPLPINNSMDSTFFLFMISLIVMISVLLKSFKLIAQKEK